MTLRALLARPDVVEVLELRGRVGFLAFHGGALERVTDIVAAEAADQAGASYYGVLHPEDAPHVPSTAFDPAHSIALAQFLDHVDVAIAIHGYGRRDLRRTVLLGGRNRDLARHLRVELDGALPEYQHVDDLDLVPRELRGLHARNPVNRPRAGGVQIELPPILRWHVEAKNWSDTADVGRAPDVATLIGALVTAVVSWHDLMSRQ
jgi:phage replication-related protein YjqB (UPF0714/DUF867 family)